MGATIAIATPSLGIEAAVQAAGLGVALVTSLGGVLCLTVAEHAPPVQYEEAN